MAASAARGIAAAAPAAHPPFPDELLEEIFLRLDDAFDLARASAACASFCRIVTARPFRRRFRSLHAPPVLGFLDVHGFHPAAPPHRSAPAARALARDADLAFSFLPEPRCAAVLDARDGLVLLYRRITVTVTDTFAVTDAFTELVVCDPLSRWNVLVPPIPEDLAASVSQRRHLSRLTSFLAPAPPCEDDVIDDDDKEDMRSPLLSVISTAFESESEVVAFVFVSSNGKWRGTKYNHTSSRSLPQLMLFLRRYQCSYAHGYFHWIVDSMLGYSYSLVLDLPLRSKNNDCSRAIVEAGEGMLGETMVLLVKESGSLTRPHLFPRAPMGKTMTGSVLVQPMSIYS